MVLTSKNWITIVCRALTSFLFFYSLSSFAYDTINDDAQSINLIKQQLIQTEAELSKVKQALNEKNKQIDELSQLEHSREQKQISRTENNSSAEVLSLAEHKRLLETQQASLASQQVELLNKTSTIRRQNMVMLLSLVFVVLALMIFFVLHKHDQNKKKSISDLGNKNSELAKINDKLIKTRSQLVESEKMAALGNLVAGVAHEINTPLGVSVTAVSSSQGLIDAFKKNVEANNISRSDMDKFLEKLTLSTDLMQGNLYRASELVRQFKLVAVDQSSEEKREFVLLEYLNEVLASLYPQYKKFQCDINVNCDPKLTMNSYPGEVAQLITNLVMNSTLHGFKLDDKAAINIDVEKAEDKINIVYQDNGLGIDPDKQEKIFTPFFTTKRNSGGSGLGLHICYNIAIKLGGEIKCVSSDNGAKFIISIAQNL